MARMASIPLPVTLTPRAVEEVRAIMNKKSVPEGYSLRIGIRGGGCQGLSYMLGFDKPKETDDVFEEKGVPILIEKKHTMHLLGMTIDFEEGSQARGFTFLPGGHRE